MIRLIQWGRYRLAIIAEGNTIISVDNAVYSLFPDSKTLEIFDTPVSRIGTESAISLHHGEYRMYDVYDELQLAETIHLELEDEDGYVMSYLLPRGLPDQARRRVRQITTTQQISNTNRKIIYVRLIEGGDL